MDEDDDFAHLRVGVPMPVADDDGQDEDHEQPETVTVDEIRQRAREMVQNNIVGANCILLEHPSEPTSQEVEKLDPEDTSWIDQSMMNEVDNGVRVRVVGSQRSKPTARHSNVGQMDFDVEVRSLSQGSGMCSRGYFSGPADMQRVRMNASSWSFGPKIRDANPTAQGDLVTVLLSPAIRKPKPVVGH